MTQTPIRQEVATGDQISRIVDLIEPTLINVPRGLAVIALLSMTLILQHPRITADELQSGVKNTSQYICLMLEGTENHAETRMN